MLYFITGNKNKFEEVGAVIPEIEQLDIDLPEIQELDAEEVVKAKLLEAFKHHDGEFIVEDTSVHIKALNGFPGPLVKWFTQALTHDGIVELVEKLGDSSCDMKTIIGYARNPEDIHFFEGVMSGKIVRRRDGGMGTFGWDPIFIPDGYTKTFAEMGREEKNQISYRRIAAEKLKHFLNK